MTQEQKARAYDEALKKAREFYNEAKEREFFTIMSDYEEIFPVLKDSEDKRIRKEIITYLSNELHNVKQLTPRTDEFEKWITWLSLKFRIGDIIKYKSKQWTIIGIDFDNHCYDLTNDECVDFDTAHYEFELEKQKEPENVSASIIAPSCWAEEPSLQKEQKPAEWDEYTKTNLDRALQIIKKAKGTLQGYQSDDGIYECDKAIECLEHFLYRGLEMEKLAEWSDEDEDFINMLILHFNYLINKGGDSVETYKSYIEKLKSLRPQPKQEWSEEDKEMFDAFMHKLEVCDLLTNKEIMWAKLRLKSLRP